MTHDKIDYADAVADRLKSWAAMLDEFDTDQVRAVLASAAMALAQREGPRGAAAEIHDLATLMHREPLQ